MTRAGARIYAVFFITIFGSSNTVSQNRTEESFFF